MTIFGWDLSHYDSPDVTGAVREGISFMTHKAGGDADDRELGTWWGNVRHFGPEVLLGAYWVQYPGSPAARADAFLARLDSQCPGWRDRDAFILQLDCEKWGGNPLTVPGRAEIRMFCDRLVTRTHGDYLPVVYAPKWVYGDSLTGLGYPLWASSYVSGTGGFRALYPGDGSVKWAPYSGQAPLLLQYSSGATIAGQTTCDANAFRGTLDALKALLAPGKVNSMALNLSIDDREAIRQEAAEAVVGFFRGAWEAATGASTADKTKFAYLRFLRTAVGGPVDQGVLMAAIMAENNLTAEDVAAALAPKIVIPDGSELTVGEVAEAVKQALREGTGTP